ncbi:hypothetical protein ED733_000189 [Metarhizium rileyi]|uniref:Cyclin N-terminal domain-containing protein n=1 Tax=Metarhizium rileyi (strain RCEF 4871) TaxID=1649241 RepID=A0A5C6FZ15_METRR|nr:hypothetical protein ED733_000189 [Metarhizium rileyi]
MTRTSNDEDGDEFLIEPTCRALVNFLEYATLRACGGLYFTPTPGATSLRSFIARILHHSKTRLNVMLALPVYLGRLGWSLEPGMSVPSSTPYEAFFGCLVLTTKYLMDVPRDSSFWVYCLMCSCNNLFFTERGILELELEILKRFQWRADIHEHHLLPELDLFLEFLAAAMKQALVHPSDPALRGLPEETEHRMRWIEAFIGHITETCLNHPCVLCTDTE